MIVSEKGLLKAMKSAAKHGYHLCADDDCLVLFTARWYVRLVNAELPRSVLALLVQHIGIIPSEGDCFLVTAKEGAQTVMKDTMDAEIRKWSVGTADTEAKLAPLLFKGRQIFQTENRKCYAVDPAVLELLQRLPVERRGAAVVGGNRLLWSGNASVVILPAMRPVDGDGDDELLAPWKALESTEWT